MPTVGVKSEVFGRCTERFVPYQLAPAFGDNWIKNKQKRARPRDDWAQIGCGQFVNTAQEHDNINRRDY